MSKKLVNFRLSDAAIAHLLFCVAASGRRAAVAGLPGPSQGEVVEQALARYARYLASLKTGKGGDRKKKTG